MVYSNGEPGYTNSPGETNCTYCHATFPLNDTLGLVAINVPGMTNNSFVPGQTYTVNLQVKRLSAILFGFDFEALDTSGAGIGTLSLLDPSSTTLSNVSVLGKNRMNVTHYGGFAANDSCIFSFTWTAPVTYQGVVKFYAAANAANGDGAMYGDHIYCTGMTLTAQTNLGSNPHAENDMARCFVYPNPATESVKVNFTLSQRSFVRFRIFDERGTCVVEQEFQEMERGVHELNMTGAEKLRNGIYRLQLITRDQSYISSFVMAR